MYVLIISDIHDNMINLEKCLTWSEKNNIKTLFCCGDITNAETLKYLATNFIGSIYLVRGNMEIYEEDIVKEYQNIKYLGRFGSFVFDKHTVGMCHEDFMIEKLIKNTASDIIFYGHTHKPWKKKINNCDVINPGTLGGVFQKSTFALWDSDKNDIELKILDLLRV